MTTPQLSKNSRFLGLDTQQLLQALMQTRKNLANVHIFAWLKPVVPIRVRLPDGKERLWFGEKVSPRPTQYNELQNIRFHALVLPEDAILRRNLRLPHAATADAAQAVALEVQAVSPFKPNDVVWGYRTRTTSDHLHMDIALTSRSELVRQLSNINSTGKNVGSPEIWVLDAQGQNPIVFAGFGEKLRASYVTLWHRVRVALLLTALAMAAAAAITPTLQLRERANEAAAAYGLLAQKTAPLLRKRESLAQATELIKELEQTVANYINPVQAMELLTRALPDDTSLLTLQIQGLKATLSGQTPSAPALMKRLSAEAWIRNVQAPQAATRPIGSNKDSFNIEFEFNTSSLLAPVRTSATATTTVTASTTSIATATTSMSAVVTSPSNATASTPPAALAAPTAAFAATPNTARTTNATALPKTPPNGKAAP